MHGLHASSHSMYFTSAYTNEFQFWVCLENEIIFQRNKIIHVPTTNQRNFDKHDRK